MSQLKKRKLERSAPAPKSKVAKRSPSVESSESSEPAVQDVTDAPDDANSAPKKTFAELGVIDSLCEACENLKYKFATP